MKSISILLVEDDHLDATDLRRSLDKLNILYNLHNVKNGEEAIDYLHDKSKEKVRDLPDFIIIDINMPKMNGLELLKAIRNNLEWKNLKCFILTTSNDRNERKEAEKLGISGFITKPLKLNSPSMDAFNLMIDLMNFKNAE